MGIHHGGCKEGPAPSGREPIPQACLPGHLRVRWSRVIDWSCIRLEPSIPGLKHPLADWHFLTLHLPLLDDGRLVWSRLRSQPEKAWVECSIRGARRATGRIVIVNEQCICVWSADSEAARTGARLVGSRFGLGDVIGIRPSGATLKLFTVTRLWTAH